MKRLFFLLPLAALSLNSCIKSEPLNPEADILEFKLPDEFAPFLMGVKVTNTEINVFVKKSAEINAVKPTIEITPGASIYPLSGEERNFEETLQYTVTSPNGENQKEYNVNFISNIPLEYDFERWKENIEPLTRRKYDYAYEFVKTGEKDGEELGKDITIWDSGNPGIAIYSRPPYPTAKAVLPEDVFAGDYSARMETLKGPGNILNQMYIPIVAGSLFIGNFKLEMNEPLNSPKFGVPFFNIMPKRFEGHFKYKEGSGDYIDKDGKPVPNASDSCSIYSVLYEFTGNENIKWDGMLTGVDILDSKKIVARAWVPRVTGTPANEFVYFNVPFEYPYGEDYIDFENKKYYFTVVFSSSFRGDYYEGKVGSTLVVDNVKVLADELSE